MTIPREAKARILPVMGVIRPLFTVKAKIPSHIDITIGTNARSIVFETVVNS